MLGLKPMNFTKWRLSWEDDLWEVYTELEDKTVTYHTFCDGEYKKYLESFAEMNY